jgi:hypothetical protein
MDSLYQLLPVLAAVLFGIATVAAALRPGVAWTVPALVAVLFLGWSLFTVSAEGLTAVWTEHTRNAWGNQIWFDLLIAIAIAWALLLPRARAAGMRTWPWLALICATGCIGLAAMFARCRYLETRPTILSPTI